MALKYQLLPKKARIQDKRNGNCENDSFRIMLVSVAAEGSGKQGERCYFLGTMEGGERDSVKCFLLVCFQACRELSENCVSLHSIDT